MGTMAGSGGGAGAAQVAMFAGVAGDQIGLGGRFITGSGRAGAVADHRKRVDDFAIGRDRHQAEQNDMQGDRVDRHPTHGLPGQTAHAQYRLLSSHRYHKG